jgi:hypothetical protein
LVQTQAHRICCQKMKGAVRHECTLLFTSKNDALPMLLEQNTNELQLHRAVNYIIHYTYEYVTGRSSPHELGAGGAISVPVSPASQCCAMLIGGRVAARGGGETLLASHTALSPRVSDRSIHQNRSSGIATRTEEEQAVSTI